MLSRNGFGKLSGNGFISINQSPLAYSLYTKSSNGIPIAPGSAQLITTENSFILDTEDGSRLITE